MQCKRNAATYISARTSHAHHTHRRIGRCMDSSHHMPGGNNVLDATLFQSSAAKGTTWPALSVAAMTLASVSSNASTFPCVRHQEKMRYICRVVSDIIVHSALYYPM